MSSGTTPRHVIVRVLLAVLGLGLVAAGSYFLYASLTAKAPALQAPSAAVKASTKKKTEEQKAAYTTAPTHPRELTISKLGIDANILPVGSTNGVMNAPESAWDVGWYDKSGHPGAGSGAILIDGHVNDTLNSPGVFYNLAKLARGDVITIERGDEKKVSYSVVKVQDIPLRDVDMAAMLVSIQKGKEGLNLITCGGSYDYQKKTFDHRILVFAVSK